MGNVSGRLEDGAAMYLRDQWRLSIASIQVVNSQGRVLLRIAPNAFPCTKVVARREAGDEGLVEFVQDPDPSSSTPLLLKLPTENELNLIFTFIVRRREETAGTASASTVINGLTFITASSARDIDNLVTREFHADPNLHKNPNVNLIGDFSTDELNAVQFDYKWRWRPPQGSDERANMGWRSTCSFVEYDQRAHKLSTLAQFAFWVPRPPRGWPPSPAISPEYMLNVPPKLRVSSTGCRGNGDQTDGELPSPLIDNFDGSTLAPSITNIPAVKVDNCPRPVEGSIGDDGPLFRATIKSLEQKTGNLRTKMKKVLKRADQARQAQITCNDAFSAFMESLRDASTSGNAPGIQPALDHYFERTYREILLFERQNERNLQKLIIEPLTKLYHMDLKQAESKKRDFEEESRDYYSYVSRYLGIRNDSSKEKKKIESETKYQTKRKNFELKRFDYSTFMQDLHGGRKEQEVLAQLTKFADAQARGFLNTAKRVQELLPELEALDYEVKETAKEFQMQRTEREERRRWLEKNNQAYMELEVVPSFVPPTTPSSNPPSSSDILGFNTSFERLGMGTSSVRAVSSGSEGGQDASLSPTSVLGPGPHHYRSPSENALVVDKETERRKEGLLWALSRPGSHVDPKGLNKQAWHKYWVVLAGGQLCEYSNWKQKLGLHNDPINLKMASVREARNSDRRFCFEVVTPQYKRVYQATSEEDMNTWISSINNAVKSTIESGGSIKNFDSTPIENGTEPAQLKNIQSALTGKSPHYHHTVHGGNSISSANNVNNILRRTTVGGRPTNIRRNSSNFGEDPEKLLQMIRDADPGNSSCADCGSQVKTEWVSINLGIVLCIECSGLHRSLGTHISKVRSLTLDVTSFTPDLVELLCQVGNRVSNSVWEARADPTQRPGVQSSREARLKFITAKYVQRAFVAPLSPTLSLHASPDELLLDAARKNDLTSALYALALHASPTTFDSVTNTNVVIMSLAAADPPSSNSSGSELSASTQPAGLPTTFPLAELIMQNGGEIPFPVSTTGLSQSAKNYVTHKTAKRLNQQASPAPSRGSSTHESPTSSFRERQQERLQKRVSSGARLHRSPIVER